MIFGKIDPIKDSILRISFRERIFERVKVNKLIICRQSKILNSLKKYNLLNEKRNVGSKRVILLNSINLLNIIRKDRRHFREQYVKVNKLIVSEYAHNEPATGHTSAGSASDRSRESALGERYVVATSSEPSVSSSSRATQRPRIFSPEERSIDSRESGKSWSGDNSAGRRKRFRANGGASEREDREELAECGGRYVRETTCGRSKRGALQATGDEQQATAGATTAAQSPVSWRRFGGNESIRRVGQPGKR